MMSALRIPAALSTRWRSLGEPAHDYLRGFLTHETPLPLPAHVAAEEAMPMPFHADLIAGAPRLRAAFPALVRSIAAIDDVEVRIMCEGTHDGPFFDLMLATGRRVQFVESHRLELRAGRVAADHVSIDLRAIIRQLAGVLSAT